MGYNEADNGKQLERMPADTRGPHEYSRISSLLDRRHTARISLLRPDRAALGRHDRCTAADTQGPYKFGHISSLLD